MRKWLELLIGIIYPRHCPVCQEIVAERGEKICRGCKKVLIYIKEPCCKKCGKEIEREEQEYCTDCTERKHVYTRGLAVFPYDERMKKAVYQMKFHNKREYCDFFSESMAEKVLPVIGAWKPQAILPVPLHPKKYRRRGFNQAEILAKGIGERLGLPVNRGLIRRTAETVPQKELDWKDRRKNMKHAFSVPNAAEGVRRALIVDDIYTTGATIDAMAEALLESGVEEVYFIALCIGKTL